MFRELSPWNLLLSLAGALSVFNLIADFNWVRLSETAEQWIVIYRDFVSVVFSPLMPILAQAEFEFTPLEQQIFVAVALLVGSTWRGLMTGPTTRAWLEENRPSVNHSKSGGPPPAPLNALQILFVTTIALLLTLAFFVIAPLILALAAVALSLASVLWYGVFLHPEKELRKLRLSNVAMKLGWVFGWLVLLLVAVRVL